MASATRFFYKHAGYSYDPKTETKNQGRWRCAKELAQAERFADEHDWSYEWTYDQDGHDSLGDHEYWCEKAKAGVEHEHEVLVCVLRDANGNVLSALGGIIDPNPNYGRVIEAELALEAAAESMGQRYFGEEKS